MDTDQDLKDAQYLSQQYPELDYWRKCINDKDLRGFVTDDEDNDQDDNYDTIASHNLSNLLEILEKSYDASEKVDESDKEWDEMCQILSQKTNESRTERAESPELLCSDDDDQGIDGILGEKEHENSFEMCQILSQETKERKAESPEILCSDDDDDQGIDEILGEKYEHENSLKRKPSLDIEKNLTKRSKFLSQKTNENKAERAESPEPLCSDDDDQSIDEILAEEEHENSLKRKPSLDIDKNVTKRSKLDDLDDTFNPSQDCSVYSRKNTSSPSILQELDFVEDEKNESGYHLSQSDIKSPVKLSVSPMIEIAPPKSPNQFDETDHIQSLILQELDFADLDDKNESGDHIKQSDIKSPVKLSVSSIMETALPKSPNQGFSKSSFFPIN